MSAIKKKKESTVRTEIQEVFTFIQFLDARRRLISSVDDELLQIFCDESLHNVRRNRISRGDEQANQRTVNSKLRKAYWFIWWYKIYHCPSANLIGPVDCRVTSSLTSSVLKAKNKRNHDGGFKTRFLSADERFPLCFRRVGSPSIHRTQTVPSKEEIESIYEYLSQDGIDFLSARNVLFQKIAVDTGLRRESIASLRIEQFSEQAIDSARRDVLRVVPDHQKFSYQFGSDIPMELAYQILYFVESYYKPLYERRAWPLSRGGGLIFTSERSGRPVSSATFTRIFSAAFKELNAGKGTAVHILRHYYTTAEIVREIKKRLEKGMDTSLLSVCRAVSLKLGHTNLDSIRPYVSLVISSVFNELEDASTRKVTKR